MTSVHFHKARILALCLAGPLALASCATEPAFVAADYSKCQELGFQQGSREYAICLSEVQKRRTSFAAAPEPITE